MRTIAVKATNDHQIIPFHDQSGRSQDAPANGLGIGPNGLENAHVVLVVSGFFGLIDEALEVDVGFPSVPLELGHATAHVGDSAIIGVDHVRAICGHDWGCKA